MQGLRDLLLTVYAEVYSSQLTDPFYTPERYWERLESYARWPGFALVTGWLGDDLIGYSLGYTLPKIPLGGGASLVTSRQRPWSKMVSAPSL